MDSLNTDKSSQNGEIENPDEFIFNKINDDNSNEQSTKINSDQPSISENKNENNKNLE